MTVTYTPTTHVAPITATVTIASLVSNIEGLSPGQSLVALTDGRAPANVFLPTAISSDGFPTGMVGLATNVGAVT